MSEKFIERINKQLSKGILPEELDFREKEVEILDVNKIKYQSFYRTYDYAAHKFPSGWANDPIFSKVIEMNIPQLSPLEELEERIKEAETSINEKAIN